jgi:hypothetical protein
VVTGGIERSALKAGIQGNRSAGIRCRFREDGCGQLVRTAAILAGRVTVSGQGQHHALHSVQDDA